MISYRESKSAVFANCHSITLIRIWKTMPALHSSPLSTHTHTHAYVVYAISKTTCGIMISKSAAVLPSTLLLHFATHLRGRRRKKSLVVVKNNEYSIFRKKKVQKHRVFVLWSLLTCVYSVQHGTHTHTHTRLLVATGSMTNRERAN